MHLLGNDLIDLKDRDSIGVLENSSFLQRVYPPGEQTLIHDSASPYVTAWLLWGAKESAYKALRRKQPDTIFSPKNIRIANDFKSVEINHTPLTLEYKLTDDWVHVWCHNLADSPETAVTPLASIKESHPEAYSRESSLCRQFAISHLEKRLGFAPQIKKKAESPRHPPLLYQQDKPLPHLLSLSHHGGYCGLAFYEKT